MNGRAEHASGNGAQMAYESTLFDIIERHMGADARSQQTRIGPSGLGTMCYHCLGCMLAEKSRHQKLSERWLAFIGQCVHMGLAAALDRENNRIGYRRFEPEMKVTVGEVLGVPITGSSDCYDSDEETIVDWKVVGDKVVNDARRGVVNPTYLNQVQMYGAGVRTLGKPVKRCVVMYLPRNMFNLRKGVAVVRDYDQTIVDGVLKRANDIAKLIEENGADNVIPRLKRLPGCKDCERYGI